MSDRPRATTNRRTILKAGSTLAIAGLITPAATVAQTDLPIEIEQFPEEEYVVLRNTGDEDIDLTGYGLNFEDEEDSQVDQVRQLSGDVVLAPGEEVSVATGAQTTIDTDVTLVDPYDGYVLNNDGNDIVSLVDPDENVVVSTDGSGSSGDSDGTDGGDSTGDDGDDSDGSSNGDDSGGDNGDDDDGEDGESSSDDSDGDGTDSSGDDEGDDGDGSDESTDDSDTDDEDKGKTDADGDGVAASDDADDDCAKVS